MPPMSDLKQGSGVSFRPANFGDIFLLHEAFVPFRSLLSKKIMPHNANLQKSTKRSEKNDPGRSKFADASREFFNQQTLLIVNPIKSIESEREIKAHHKQPLPSLAFLLKALAGLSRSPFKAPYSLHKTSLSRASLKRPLQHQRPAPEHEEPPDKHLHYLSHSQSTGSTSHLRCSTGRNAPGSR